MYEGRNAQICVLMITGIVTVNFERFPEYISPAYEKLGFDLCRDHLVSMGYPQDIREFEYDPSFALR